MTDNIELQEFDKTDIYKDGEPKLGSYWLGWDLVFGVHIPTHGIDEAKYIMKNILSWKENAEKYQELKFRESSEIFGILEQKINQLEKDKIFFALELSKRNEEVEFLEHQNQNYKQVFDEIGELSIKGIPHDSFSEEYTSGNNKDIKSTLKNILSKLNTNKNKND
jgi:hypothetical protein